MTANICPVLDTRKARMGSLRGTLLASGARDVDVLLSWSPCSACSTDSMAGVAGVIGVANGASSSSLFGERLGDGGASAPASASGLGVGRPSWET
jgi:hypothetical protein